MKNLKKFQGFALTQEEQQEVKGGRLGNWNCRGNNGDSQNFDYSMGGIMAGAAWALDNGGGSCSYLAY